MEISQVSFDVAVVRVDSPSEVFGGLFFGGVKSEGEMLQ